MFCNDSAKNDAVLHYILVVRESAVVTVCAIAHPTSVLHYDSTSDSVGIFSWLLSVKHSSNDMTNVMVAWIFKTKLEGFEECPGSNQNA